MQKNKYVSKVEGNERENGDWENLQSNRWNKSWVVILIKYKYKMWIYEVAKILQDNNKIVYMTNE